MLRDEARLAALGASDIADVASRARALRERIKGQRNVIGERRRRLEGELQAAVDDGLVSNLEAESARLAQELTAAEADTRRLRPEFERLAQSEALLSSEQLTFDTEWGDELAPKPTRAPELRAELAALAKAGQRSQAELQRVGSELQASTARRQRVETEAAQAAETLARLATERPQLDQAATAAQQARRQTETALTELTEQRREADAEAHRWAARRDALRQALDAARSAAGATALAEQAGVLGVLLDLVAIDDDWELAVEAAAGEALQAVVIDNPRNGAAALAALEANDLAGAVLALGRGTAGSGAGSPVAGVAAPPAGTSRLRDRVRARRDDVSELLDALFASAVVADGTWRQAMEVATSHPELVVVTRHGDRFSPAGWRIGLSGTGATGAALEEAESKAAFAKGEAERVAAELQAAQAASRDAANKSRSVEDQRRQATQSQERAAGLRDRSTAQLNDFAADTAKLEQRRSELAAQARADEDRAARLRAELPAVENEEAEYLKRVEALSHSRTSLEERTRGLAQARRDLEVKAAAIEARQEQLANRRAETETRLERLVGERERARIRREALETAIGEVDALSDRLGGLSTRVAAWIEVLEAEHRAQSESARQVSAELTARRAERQGAERELVEVRERRSRVELGEAENRVKLEAITDALRRELDTEPAVAMATELPEIEGDASPEARVRDLERELKLLGPINPLALEEFEALKERHDFLDGQLDDVKTARRDLNQLIRSIDEEIVQVFSAAFADVSHNFVALFTGLFPGGKGAITLTNPDDLLNCGVEVEAKPSGKNVKKLSLLSGGERSLVALAFLFAVFRSRPSPFYVMDEVEAALDDVNLSRFLALLEEFRKEAQLIVVSHQKRTHGGGRRALRRVDEARRLVQGGERKGPGPQAGRPARDRPARRPRRPRGHGRRRRHPGRHPRRRGRRQLIRPGQGVDVSRSNRGCSTAARSPSPAARHRSGTWRRHAGAAATASSSRASRSAAASSGDAAIRPVTSWPLSVWAKTTASSGSPSLRPTSCPGRSWVPAKS